MNAGRSAGSVCSPLDNRRGVAVLTYTGLSTAFPLRNWGCSLYINNSSSSPSSFNTVMSLDARGIISAISIAVYFPVIFLGLSAFLKFRRRAWFLLFIFAFSMSSFLPF